MLFNKIKMLFWIFIICIEGVEKVFLNFLCFCFVILEREWMYNVYIKFILVYSEIKIELMLCIYYDINWNKICLMVW